MRSIFVASSLVWSILYLPVASWAQLDFVTTSELKKIVKLQADQNYQVLDLRTPEELSRTGKIKGAQVFDYNSGQFANYLKQLSKNKRYIIYCRSGGRSGRALTRMKKLGFNVRNYTLGMNGWLKQGLPTVKVDQSK